MSYLHLTNLRGRILSPEIATDTDYDTRLEPVANGVSEFFDQYCNRSLRRDTAVVDTFTGDSDFFRLSTFPVEASTMTLEYKDSDSDTFATLEYEILDEKSGLITLATVAGDYSSEVRASYQGGYFVDLAEALDTTLPSGATAMPADLLDAWCLQVQLEAQQRGIFRVGAEASADDSQLEGTQEMSRRVRNVLNKYARF